jgi:hypothetical protein
MHADYVSFLLWHRLWQRIFETATVMNSNHVVLFRSGPAMQRKSSPHYCQPRARATLVHQSYPWAMHGGAGTLRPFPSPLRSTPLWCWKGGNPKHFLACNFGIRCVFASGCTDESNDRPPFYPQSLVPRTAGTCTTGILGWRLVAHLHPQNPARNLKNLSLIPPRLHANFAVWENPRTSMLHARYGLRINFHVI